MLTVIWIMFAIAFIILVVSMLMSPDSNSFSGALVGSSDLDLFKVSKERGSKKTLKRVMFACGIFMMIAALITRVLM